MVTKKIKIVWVLLFFISVMLTAVQGNSKEVTGKITGRVINKTNGERVVPNVKITLKKFTKEGDGREITTTSNYRGQFKFTNLPVLPSNTYQLETVYQGGEYYGKTINFKGQGGIKKDDIIVYDSTDKEDNIKVNFKHIIINPDNDGLQISEVINLNNTGNKSYIGWKKLASGKNETLRFSLPEGVKKINITKGLMECCIEQSGEIVSDTMAVLPGTKEISFSYKLNYDSTDYNISKKLTYDIDSLMLIIPEKISVKNEYLKPVRKIERNGVKYQLFSGKNIKKSSILNLKFSNLPFQNVIINYAKEGSVFLIGFLVILILAYPIYKKKLSRTDKKNIEIEKSSDKSLETISKKRKKLIADIAHLDIDFDKEKLIKSEYILLRKEKKKKLIEYTLLLKKNKNSSG